MADNDVVPKKRSSVIIWLLFGHCIIIVLFFLTHSISKDELNRTATTLTTAAVNKAKYNWNIIDFDAPAANYNEITCTDVFVKGTNDYAIYSLKEEKLFDKFNSSLRPQAENLLLQISNSIEQRYTNGLVRIYGAIDNANKASGNRLLEQQRSETVRTWLAQNGNIDATHITLQPLEETKTVPVGYSGKYATDAHFINIVARRAY